MYYNVSFIIFYNRYDIITIDCGFEMIVDIVHRTAVCGLVGITIYGLFLISRGALSMEKARREAVRLRKAENSDKVFIILHVIVVHYISYRLSQWSKHQRTDKTSVNIITIVYKK